MDITSLTKTLDEIATPATSEIEVFEALYTVTQLFNELEDLFDSYGKVEEIKDAIAGREIGKTFIEYAGEAIGTFAPAFVEGNSALAVEQMEEGMKEVGKKIIDIIKHIIEKIKAFFKRIYNFLLRKNKSKQEEEPITDKLSKATSAISVKIKEGHEDKQIYIPRHFINQMDFSRAADNVYSMCKLLKKAATNGTGFEQIEKLSLDIAESFIPDKIKISELNSIRGAAVFYKSLLDPKQHGNLEKAYSELDDIVIPNDIPLETARKIANDLSIIQKFIANFMKMVMSAPILVNSIVIE